MPATELNYILIEIPKGLKLPQLIGIEGRNI